MSGVPRTVTMPAQTDEQRFQNLVIANRTRIEIVAWKKMVGTQDTLGGIEVVKDLLMDEERLGGSSGKLRVAHALLAIQRVGTQKVDDLLKDVGVARPDRRLHQLTRRQREELWLAVELRLGKHARRLRDGARP